VYPDIADAAPEGLAAFLTAVTAHHAAARAAARARGDLRTIARRVSHEMRSPLGSILTSVDVLREELADQPGIVDGLLQPIVESASDMIKLLDRLSLVARASAMPAKSGRVEMGMIVWSAQERLATRIAAAGATITETETWPEAWGVAGWLEHVWETLLANALEHAGGDGPVIELGWEGGEGELRFFVRDHGQGVAPAVQRLLFRPFHQLHQTDSGRATGLAVVQRLIEIQGGRCGYAPVEPHGACFYFTLPAKAPNAAPVS
jgi:signal transduction histidine kinase